MAVGLDLGTSGARAVAVDFTGHIVAEGRSALPSEATCIAGGLRKAPQRSREENIVLVLSKAVLVLEFK